MRTVAGTGVRLYDTIQAKVVPLVPSGRTVRMYTCGLTPNQPAHVGHAATFLASTSSSDASVISGSAPAASATSRM